MSDSPFERLETLKKELRAIIEESKIIRGQSQRLCLISQKQRAERNVFKPEGEKLEW